MGVSTDTVFLWENNRKGPSLYSIPKIIQFLGYTPFVQAKTLGKKLKTHRKIHGMTQKELAQRIGVDPGTLAKWEAGRRKPTKVMLDRVMAYLEGSAPVFFTLKGVVA